MATRRRRPGPARLPKVLQQIEQIRWALPGFLHEPLEGVESLWNEEQDANSGAA